MGTKVQAAGGGHQQKFCVLSSAFVRGASFPNAELRTNSERSHYVGMEKRPVLS